MVAWRGGPSRPPVLRGSHVLQPWACLACPVCGEPCEWFDFEMRVCMNQRCGSRTWLHSGQHADSEGARAVAGRACCDSTQQTCSLSWEYSGIPWTALQYCTCHLRRCRGISSGVCLAVLVLQLRFPQTHAWRGGGALCRQCARRGRGQVFRGFHYLRLGCLGGGPVPPAV